MNVDIETLVTYPTESNDWILTVAIGGVLLFLSVLLVPWFLVAGYLVRTIRSGLAGDEEPPAFDEWGELLKEGFFASVIGFVYQIVPLAAFAVFVGGSAIAFLTGSEAGAGLGALGLVGGFFLSWLLSLVFGYVGLAGIANYASEGTFGAGFDFDVVLEAATSRAYLIAWIYVVAVNIVAGVITTVLNIVPLVGAIIGVFVGFYALVVSSWLWGSGFAEATGAGPTAEPAA